MDLYGLPPEEFTAARDAAAKVDKGLKALRRPTLSAWIVNTLVREAPDLLDDLASLGAELADAQRDGRGEDLRQLADRRKQLVASAAQRAVDLVERDIAPAARTEVEQTLEAVLTDPASAEAVRTGQLVRALSFAGFGGVDLDGAVAPLPRPAGPRTQATPDISVAERKALDAAGALDDAVRRAQDVAKALKKQESILTEAQEAERQADAATHAAQQAVRDAEEGAKAAHRSRIAAQKEQEALARKASSVTKAVGIAQDAADAARVALDKLRRG